MSTGFAPLSANTCARVQPACPLQQSFDAGFPAAQRNTPAERPKKAQGPTSQPELGPKKTAEIFVIPAERVRVAEG